MERFEVCNIDGVVATGGRDGRGIWLTRDCAYGTPTTRLVPTVGQALDLAGEWADCCPSALEFAWE